MTMEMFLDILVLLCYYYSVGYAYATLWNSSRRQKSFLVGNMVSRRKNVIVKYFK